MADQKTKKTAGASLKASSIPVKDLNGVHPVRMPVAALARLMRETLNSVLQTEEEWFGLLYIPSGFIRRFGKTFTLGNSYRDASFLSIENTRKGNIKTKIISTLPHLHPLRKVCLLFIVGPSATLSIQFQPLKGDNWQGKFGLTPEEVVKEAERFANNLGDTLPEVSHQFDRIITDINRKPKSKGATLFAVLLRTVLAEYEKAPEASLQDEQDIGWMRIMAHIRETVSWELDESRLHNSIARALKETVGYDYIEILTVQQVERRYETVTLFQRNDTKFGGNLLTVILKPEKQLEILQGKRPFLVTPENADKALMNPRLMTYMGFGSGLLIPLVHQRRTHGLLKFFSQQSNRYSPDDANRMLDVGRIIAKSFANARLLTSARRMAIIDGLTGTFNRRYFIEQFSREWKRALRYKKELSLLMIDIDYFKNYNDSHGHLQGDNILSTVGRLLRENVREFDIVCRYGGEEFAVILPETDTAKAIVVAEKVRQTIEHNSFRFGEAQPKGKITISIGIAENNSEVENPEDLINRADVALYRAKKLGRNRCELYDK